MKKTILVINGPNLNLLGTREPDLYGLKSYEDLKKLLMKQSDRDYRVTVKQSNYEGRIIEWLQTTKAIAIVLNPGGYTHYSISILDAIRAIKTPVIEVHLTDITKRSDRPKSVITEACKSTFMGEHFESYIKAINYVKRGYHNA